MQLQLKLFIFYECHSNEWNASYLSLSCCLFRLFCLSLLAQQLPVEWFSCVSSLELSVILTVSSHILSHSLSLSVSLPICLSFSLFCCIVILFIPSFLCHSFVSSCLVFLSKLSFSYLPAAHLIVKLFLVNAQALYV